MESLAVIKKRKASDTDSQLHDIHDNVATVTTDSHVQAIDKKQLYPHPKSFSSSISTSRRILSGPTRPAPAWFFYIGFLALLFGVAFQAHYTLPTPVTQLYDPVTGEPQFSESNVRRIVKYLSKDIGYRIVGTEQDQETQLYLLSEIKDLERRQALAQAQAQIKELPKLDTWVQVANGSHQFDFMSKAVMKMYTNMTNIIVRLSCGAECDKNAILLNGHYDTTLGSPGAVDDALAIGVMLEMIRVMSLRPSPKMNSLIFLFNGGVVLHFIFIFFARECEESLQDASHSFITNHKLKDTVKAVINLEGCGTTGPEILFQANSRPMVEAYGRVPYPHGTVMGNDLFSTGVILSDTDFRQFVDYGQLTGLDMAVYKNSYLYHTHLDLEDQMEQGLPQHMGENTLALATYLTSRVPLDNLDKTSKVVYFDVFGLFLVLYSMKVATVAHIAIGLLALWTVAIGASRPTLRSTVSVAVSCVAALLAPNICAIALQLLGGSMVWFTHEWYCLAIFGPLSALGIFSVQYFAHDSKASTGANELSTLSGIQMVYTVAMTFGTIAEIASSYFLAMYALFTSIALLFNYQKVQSQARTNGLKSVAVATVDYGTYFVAAVIQTPYFTYLAFSLLDLVVPLTGRTGVDAPVDHVMAVITGFGIFSFSPTILAFAHRFGPKTMKKILFGLAVAQGAILLLSSSTLPVYDTMHPKRVLVQHLRNLTSGESLLHVAHADPGPILPYVAQVEETFNVKAEFRSGGKHPDDWNSVYPFSQFLDSYVLDTTPYIRSHTTNKTIANSDKPLTELIEDGPKLVAENVKFDQGTGIRSMTILCTHPNYIWTVSAFDAEVVSWSLDIPVPTKDRFHYVVRNAGGYRSDGWRLDLVYRVPDQGHQKQGISNDNSKNNNNKKNDNVEESHLLRVELTAMETEGFGKDLERELKGSGDIGVLRQVVSTRPDYVTLTYFSSVVSVFFL
ncbi:hypothetical protein BG004_003521 [Podila humilis]|nr:hypothetical protein BG004_003521 [Podila humilis]